jgi:hypothetical protein
MIPVVEDNLGVYGDGLSVHLRCIVKGLDGMFVGAKGAMLLDGRPVIHGVLHRHPAAGILLFGCADDRHSFRMKEEIEHWVSLLKNFMINSFKEKKKINT